MVNRHADSLINEEININKRINSKALVIIKITGLKMIMIGVSESFKLRCNCLEEKLKLLKYFSFNIQNSCDLLDY